MPDTSLVVIDTGHFHATLVQQWMYCWSALIRTPAPIPGISLETFSMYELPSGEISIGVPTLEKPRTSTPSHPPVGVPGGVADDILPRSQRSDRWRRLQ